MDLPTEPEVGFRYYPDVEDAGSHQGWRLDVLDIYYQQRSAGYLKISQIPQALFERYYPDALAYACRVEGRALGLKPYLGIPVMELSATDLAEVVYALELTFNYRAERPVSTTPRSELLTRYRAGIDGITQAKQKDYLKFKDLWANRPVVDYISIYGDGDKVRIAGQATAEPAVNHRRLGLGKLLYLAGGILMYEQGMELRASSLQSPAAMAIWQQMETEGLTIRRQTPYHNFKVLDGEIIRERYPNLVLEMSSLLAATTMDGVGLVSF